MKDQHSVRRFKSMAVALRELEPFVRNGQHLMTGRPFEAMGGLRSREILVNWLVCTVGNFERGREAFTFSSDPTEGDGIIYDLDSGTGFETEHVMITRYEDSDVCIEDKIAAAVARKQAKGPQYASGKALLVLNDSGGGDWYPVRAARKIQPNDFEDVWVIGLDGAVVEGPYSYGVSHLDYRKGHAPTWRVKVAADFSTWEVERIQ